MTQGKVKGREKRDEENRLLIDAQTTITGLARRLTLLEREVHEILQRERPDEMPEDSKAFAEELRMRLVSDKQILGLQTVLTRLDTSQTSSSKKAVTDPMTSEVQEKIPAALTFVHQRVKSQGKEASMLTDEIQYPRQKLSTTDTALQYMEQGKIMGGIQPAETPVPSDAPTVVHAKRGSMHQVMYGGPGHVEG
ncbi:unnamed protein product [Trypanosoma congolense IL3000]|uniref:WGS project CAEQ00000000 data, annotated contig 514 n=1 Tax=Trypanosoma congolense (strain IL3000) TaxID=1068625 RepID=F9WGL4_TRYCI|nr:unnamed protein product [Trypanosoma congolense IL3000]